MIFLAWIRESRPVEGWTCFEVVADSYDEAVDKAREHLRGVRHGWTLDVECQSVDARAA